MTHVIDVPANCIWIIFQGRKENSTKWVDLQKIKNMGQGRVSKLGLNTKIHPKYSEFRARFK